MAGISIRIEGPVDVCVHCHGNVAVYRAKEAIIVEQEAMSPIGEEITVRVAFCSMTCLIAVANAERWENPQTFQKWASDSLRQMKRKRLMA